MEKEALGMRISLNMPASSRAVSSSQWTEVFESNSEKFNWIRAIDLKLELIRNALYDWDNQGGEPIHSRIVNIACELLVPLASMEPPIPRIAPVLGGGIQFEWEYAGRELEVEILPDGTVEYLIAADDGTVEEGQLPDMPVRQVQILVQWLVQGQ